MRCLLLLVSALSFATMALAQEPTLDSVPPKPVAPAPPTEEEAAKPKEPLPPLFTDIHVWGDYLKPALQFANGQEQYEFGAGILLWNMVQLGGSYGIANLNFGPPSYYFNGNYLAEGSYWRAGADFMVRAQATTKTWVGLRYGQSSFTDHATATLNSPLWGEYTIQESRDLNVGWAELIIGSEIAPFDNSKVFKNLYLGWIFRFRTFNNLEQFEAIPVEYIPGYGRAANNFNAHVNLTLRYRIPIASQVTPEK